MLTLKNLFSTCTKTIIAISIANPIYAQYRGGSNYAWYHLDYSYCATNPVAAREPYGVLQNYHLQTSFIQAQLQAMYDNGQRRLVIPIYFQHAFSNGTIIDSSSGNLPPQAAANLTNLLTFAKNIGFSEFLIKINAVNTSAPFNWSTWNQTLFNENWDFIKSIRTASLASGAFIRFDLGGEMVSSAGQAVNYAKQIWNLYTAAYGKSDTVGFSMAVMPGGASIIKSQIENQLNVIYQGNPPYIFSFHIYDGGPYWNTPPGSQHDAYDMFINTFTAMRSFGYTQGWIIGETLYNDGISAQHFRNAINQTGQTVFYIAQWPVSTQDPSNPNYCGNDDNITYPLNFNSYINNGF